MRTISQMEIENEEWMQRQRDINGPYFHLSSPSRRDYERLPFRKAEKGEKVEIRNRKIKIPHVEVRGKKVVYVLTVGHDMHNWDIPTWVIRKKIEVIRE